jgi:hypothetical protein
MARTTFSGPVKSDNGFEGDFIGNITGNVTGNVTGTLTGRVVNSVQLLSGAGVVNLTTGLTALTTTGAAQALTLANGSAGQVKMIVHAVDGGSAVLTPTTKIGFTTITFTDVGDAVTLVYTSAGWAIAGISGAVAA